MAPCRPAARPCGACPALRPGSLYPSTSRRDSAQARRTARWPVPASPPGHQRGASLGAACLRPVRPAGPCAPCSRSPVGRGRVTTAVRRRCAALSRRAQCPRLTKRRRVPVQPLRRVSTTHHRRHRARLFPSIDEGPTTRHPCPHVGEHHRCVSIFVSPCRTC
jgi:hypothetical protein